MTHTIKYAKQTLKFKIQNNNFLGEIIPNNIEFKLTGEEEVVRALNNPIGSEKLSEIVHHGEKVVIVTSDITRPMPSKVVLPPVIKELKSAGIREEDITIILALGSHRPHTENEKRYLVGDKIYESNINVIDSDMSKCINLGTCNNDIPVDIFEPVVKADRVICLGNIEYHYFAGYSGGAKAIMPGVSSHRAIQANHSNMVKRESKAGNLKTNPVRQDIDQVADFIKIDFILNVVLNSSKKIVKAVAGHYLKAHRAGCKVLDSMHSVQLEQQADIVIVSPGGFPKDINLYQSQKALDNSKHAVKDGGIIILVASAKEGFGEKNFKEWMLNKTPTQMIEEIQQNFILGGHKAAAIAMVLKKAKIYLVSDLDNVLVKSIYMIPFNSIEDAINKAIEEIGDNAKILIMPAGGSTLPILK